MNSEDVQCTPLTQHICGWKVFIYFEKIQETYLDHTVATAHPFFFLNAGFIEHF